MSAAILEVEQQLKDARDAMALRDMAVKLSTNREFRKLIIEGFIQTETNRLMVCAGDVRFKKEDRDQMMESALAGGHLKRYLNYIQMVGDNAERSIPEAEQTLAQIRSEEQDGNFQADVDHNEGYLS